MKKRTWVIIVTILPFLLAIAGAIAVFTRSFSFSLSPEYLGKTDLIDITAADYDQLIREQKSFLLFVDQDGCDVATTVRKFVAEYSSEKTLSFHHVYFTDIRGTAINKYVKYYPSVVLIANGQVVDFLKANSDDYIAPYTNYDSFKTWIEKYLKFKE